MATPLQLEVLTPRRRLIQTEAEQVTLPGQVGELGVLPQHIPLVTMLNSGVLSYSTNQQRHHLAVQGGYAQVEADQVIVLVEQAEAAEDIDLSAAQESERDAQEHLKQLISAPPEDGDYDAQQRRVSQYETQLMWALARQQVGNLK
jgi:F-type H+-transporting ATPase subunit epsilon